MLRPFKILLIMAGLISSVLSGQELSNLLPSVPEGWNQTEDDRIYSTEELYDYINGGAELFLSYNMEKVISRIIASGENEIRVEIFDMQSGENAFGVFSHTRTKDERQYGQGSQFFTGTLIFWKSNFYISLTANDSNEEINKAIVLLAEDIEKKIQGKSASPDIIQLLPKNLMLTDAFVYFHHYIWQNSYHYLASDNFLNISDSTPAVLAKYGDAESRYYLLVIQYQNRDSCEQNLAIFKERFLEKSSNDFICQIEDETWWGGAEEANYFIAVLNAPSADKVEQLIQEVKNNITNMP